MPHTHPNIVIILADDMGYGDVTSYDPAYNQVPTPHIDRLATQGMHFTNAHTTSALCTPSRYGLLTGRYAWRSRLQSGVLMEWAPPLIAPDRLTLPAMLRSQGYHTACIGKWHLGWNWPKNHGNYTFDQPITGGPLQRGFDYHYGVDVPNFPPYAWIDGDRVIGDQTAWYDRDPDLVLNHPGVGVPDWPFDQVMPTLNAKAIDYIAQHAHDDTPFFLYYPLTTPHEPVAPSPQFKGKSGISGVADLIMETDRAVGQIMHALDHHGIADNTLLIFTTDNGHCPYTNLEPFQRVGHRVSGPYRGYKGDIWEGGHRVPFVARWPQTITPGTRSDHLISLADIMATCAEITHAPLPPNAAEDSVSILPLLQGQDTPTRQTAIFHSGGGNFAVLHDHWKLNLCPTSGHRQKTPPDTPPVQLYDLKTDEAETTNLQHHHPKLVHQLTACIEQTVANGRTTPGPTQPNDTQVDIWKTPRPIQTE